ncbi:ABC transporter ATP-binding protein [Fulvivirga sp. M361]|uniref:ABC transporter ATP-binding protein n=1 Tax=Fulvivirga sp. M361 TaxID=2594266 RepID=UPI00117AA2EF|nr:ABC transporter ATP-binding protein [Fulvivirga sp. M361]TRX62159.1 ABC transporter ATP-binding protein [Fulvivirga sp. M361]
METVLSIQNLTKRYGRLTAVNNLTLNVEKGSVFGILGPNGSGKTTTLGILLDVINKTSGDFTWFGAPPTKAVRKRIGAILETPIFYPYLSAAKNLEIVAEIKDAPKANIDPVLEKVELLDRRNDKFRTYSLGMKQRLSIASALICDPEVMILDEPTNGLDPQGIAEIRTLIQQIASEGKTIILASHLLDEVQKVCSHFCVLKKGTLLHSGSVDEIGKGPVTVEVDAVGEQIESVLKSWDKAIDVKLEDGYYQVKLTDGCTAQDLNVHLFDQGLIATHLLTQKKSLEKQFLELLAESENA